MAALDTDYDNSTPVHQLGQYRAWELRHDRRAPVDLVWISVAGDHPAAHRVLPHGEPSITVRRRRDKAGALTDIDLALCGPARRPFWYHPAPKEELISIRLKPETAAKVFGVSPAELFENQPAPAPDALRNACTASLRIAEKTDPHAVAQTLMSDLLRFSGAKKTVDAPELYAADWMRRSGGAVSCGELARRLDISERHLRRRFRDRLGCSPKTYARQLRLTAAALAAETEARPRWAEIAAAAGFHDQAHMINEYQTMIAMTPQQLHAERRVLSGFCNTHVQN